jgi:hypothetical protein
LNKEASENGQRGILTARRGLSLPIAVIVGLFVKKIFRSNELIISL